SGRHRASVHRSSSSQLLPVDSICKPSFTSVKRRGFMTESQSPARSPVFEFDYIADPGVLADCHDRYWELKETAPPVFWTNAHGGHWVCNTGATVQHVVRHPE